MKLEILWLVCDPTPLSEIEDIFWRQPARTLHYQIVGIAMSGGTEWQSRHYTLWTTEAEARADAEARLAARTPMFDAAPNCPHCGTKLYEVVRADGSHVKVTVPE